MRLFILFLFLVFTISTSALADGKKSFDTSMVPKRGSAPAQPTQPRRPTPPKAQDIQEPREEQPPSLLEQVLNERNDSKNHGSGMQSRTMGIPDDLKEKHKTSKNVQDDSEFLDEAEEKQVTSKKETEQEENEPSEQSIWDRYKAIANGADGNSSMKSRVNNAGNKNQVDTPMEKETSEGDEEKEKATKEYEEKRAQAGVLGRALNDYKNNKKAKTINKRSYGSLND